MTCQAPSSCARSQPSTVYLVGAGPGDPELLTRKALRCIRNATVLLVDDLVSEACLRYARRSCRIVPVGKRGGCRSTSQAFIERLMIHEAQRGERVVRLKGGDPLIFGRAGEEIEALRAAGLAVEVVPGITAASAAAAAAGVSLTDRRLAPGVAFVTGHRQSAAQTQAWVALIQSGLTLAVYMGATEAPQIRQALIEGGMTPHTPVVMVQAASTAAERRICTRLDTLCDPLADGQIAAPCLILIGAVAAQARADLACASTGPTQFTAGHGYVAAENAA